MGVFTEILGGFIDNAFAKKNLRLQQKANKELADYNYSKQMDMYNLQNSYNTPLAQMERYKEAGLNPNLVATQGSSGNTATSTPQYQQENIQYNFKNPLSKVNMLGIYQDFRIKQSNIDNLAEQNRILKAEADIREADAKFAQMMSRNKARINQSQADIIEFKKEVTANEFWSIFELKEGKYVPKDSSWYDQTIKDKQAMPSTITGNYQQSVKLNQVLEKLRGKDLEFLDNGGKYMPFFFQFMKFMRGN